MEVVCRFCKKNTTKYAITPLDKIGVMQYWCHTCDAEYLMWNDSDFINSCSLYTNLNGKRYCWTTTGTGRAVLWYIKTPGTPGKELDKDREVLFSLAPQDNQPTITPQNVADKIKTILVFL